MPAIDPSQPRSTTLEWVRQLFKPRKPLLSAMVILDMFHMETNTT